MGFKNHDATRQIQFPEIFPFYLIFCSYIPFLSYQELCREKIEFVVAEFGFLPDTQIAQICQILVCPR